MESGKCPYCFEPIKIVVNSRGRASSRTSVYLLDTPLEAREFGARYFFSKIVSENEEDFETINIGSRFLETVKHEASSLVTKIKERLSPIVSPEIAEVLLKIPDIEPYLPYRMIRGIPTSFFFYKKNPSVIVPKEGDLYVISKNRENITSLIDHLKSKSEELNRITKDFGLELVKFLTYQDYQNAILDNTPKIKKRDLGTPRNEFEEKVIKTVQSVTTSFLPNVTIQFDEPAEIFEYDVFIGFGENQKVIIEPTDYESIKDEIRNGVLATETLKSKVILATQDKAQRLRAKSVVIANGFVDDTLAKIKNLADSRGVVLMSEKDYEVGLPALLLDLVVSRREDERY